MCFGKNVNHQMTSSNFAHLMIWITKNESNSWLPSPSHILVLILLYCHHKIIDLFPLKSVPSFMDDPKVYVILTFFSTIPTFLSVFTTRHKNIFVEVFEVIWDQIYVLTQIIIIVNLTLPKNEKLAFISRDVWFTRLAWLLECLVTADRPGWEFTKLLRQICKIFCNFKVLLWSSYS